MISTNDETTSDSASIVIAKASAASMSCIDSPSGFPGDIQSQAVFCSQRRLLRSAPHLSAVGSSPRRRVGGGSTKAGWTIPAFSAACRSPILPSWRRLPKFQRNPEPRNPKPTGRTCSRSGRRWPNCSIPRSTAAMPAWARAPACSRRRTIRGTAAPAARPRRIARAPRPGEPAMTSRSAMDRTRASKKPPRPITAPRRPFPRSIPNSRASSACRPRKTTTRRWPGRRAARWKRSASRPPPTRWKT